MISTTLYSRQEIQIQLAFGNSKKGEGNNKENIYSFKFLLAEIVQN